MVSTKTSNQMFQTSSIELVSNIQQAISMIQEHIDAYHDYDTPENTEEPPEKKSLHEIMYHLMGSIEPINEVMKTDGYCSLCGQPAIRVCHCPQCQEALEEDGDDPDEGRPMCDAHCIQT